MAGKNRSLTETLDWLGALDTQHLQYEVRKLQAIRTWALEQSGVNYAEGDRVEFIAAPEINRDSGWWPYRECLVVGAPAVVTRIDFNAAHSYWYADIRLDREWAIGDFPSPGGSRYWHGPAAETPEGMEEPSSFDQEHYPEGRRHSFALPVRYLRRFALTLASTTPGA